MHHRTHTLIVTLALALAAPAARADDPDVAGALVGGSHFLLGLDVGLHSGDAAIASGAPRTAVEGIYGMLKLSAGVLMRVTRFGSEAGLEGSIGLGWIDGAAFGREESGLAADLTGGVVLAPFRVGALGGAALKLAAGFGTDHDVDYLYAAGRLGFGESGGAFGLELGYTYRVGDAPTRATLLEHRVAVNGRIDGFAFGVTWLTGESADYRGTAPPVELFQARTMRKGDYDGWIFTLGYAWRVE